MTVRTKVVCLMLTGLLTGMQGVSAQGDPEYRAEVGAGVGPMNYLGDLNGNLLKNLSPQATVMAKYKPNPRMAYSLHVSYAKLKGSASGVDTFYPATPEGLDGASVMPRLEDYEFAQAVVDVAVGFEYNFWPYGTGREYRGAKPLVPFVQGGLGLTAGGGTHGNLHFGAGVKYKLGQRWNLTAMWRAVFTGSDTLDGLKDPYGVKSSGLFKNTDGYSSLWLTLSYDLWAKCKTCHNENE